MLRKIPLVEAGKELHVNLSKGGRYHAYDHHDHRVTSVTPPLDDNEVRLLETAGHIRGDNYQKTNKWYGEIAMSAGGTLENDRDTAFAITELLAEHREVAIAQVDIYDGTIFEHESGPETTIFVRQP